MSVVQKGAPYYYERTTASWGTASRVDYLLPSTGLTVVGGGVYWPGSSDPAGKSRAETASDHRLVWIDVEK